MRKFASLILLLGLYPLAHSYDPPAYPELAPARRQFQEGRYEDAVIELLETKKRKTSDELLLLLAKAMERLENPSLEAVYWQELLSQFPESIHVPIARLRLKNLIELYLSEDFLELTVDVETSLEQGILEGRNGEHDAAILWLLKSLRLKPDSSSAHFWLGWNYHHLYQSRPSQTSYRELAMVHYRRSSSIIPSSRSLNNLACLLAQEEDPIMARYYFDKALEVAATPGIREAVAANRNGFSSRTNALRYRLLQEDEDLNP